ncbi:MAG TPA: glycerate kinase [Cyanobacteria bacterium UBA8530]|nr:glycerate kinase [Cyanobacteria bacterium UBA8530]
MSIEKSPRSILIAPDSFKGSLSAGEAARAIAKGFRSKEHSLLECPLSDGGEGFLEITVQATGGSIHWAETTDALGKEIRAPFGLIDGGKTLVVELASAAGLPGIQRNPLLATTYGVGTLIRRAFEIRPFEKMILGLGGSATIDGGAGLLEALGIRLLDDRGHPIERGGGGLSGLSRIDASEPSAALRTKILLAADVLNPLLGPSGAAVVYGPQKGANPEMIRLLEKNLENFCRLLEADPTAEGTGAAGGVPLSLVSLAGAKIASGFEVISDLVGLDKKLSTAELVLTGEGRLDKSSFEGKVVGRLAQRCRDKGILLYAIAGQVDPPGEARLFEFGGKAFSLDSPEIEASMRAAASLLENKAKAIASRFIPKN